MKNSKMLVLAGSALLVLAVLLLVFGRGDRVPVNAASVSDRASRAAPSASRGQVSAPARATAAPRTNTVAAALSPRGTKAVRITADRTMTAPIRRALEGLGARIIAPVGPRAVLAEAAPAVRNRISKDSRFTAEDVLPAAKIAMGLAERCAAHPDDCVRVNVLGLAASDRANLSAFVKSGGGEIGVCPLGPEALTARIPPTLVASLAARGDVRWIEPALELQPLNDKTVVEAGANADTLRTVHFLRGRGQKVTVCDTGLDKGSVTDVHWDFADRVREIVHIGRQDAGANGYRWALADYHGHGTHVAGTVLGDGARSSGRYKGMAQLAELYFQAASDTEGAGVWIDSYSDILERSISNESYIHSDSWGSVNNWGRYNSACAAFDTVLWTHPELLVVVAAGNDGDEGECSVSTYPACAKNVLTVGNTMSTRPTYGDWFLEDDPKNLNPTSSRGPTHDGRIKPEVAAPGTAVYSALSTMSLECNPIAGNDCYTEMTGTSMATPLVSGTAALVREWLAERRGMAEKPTAALMKAILAGGGVAMTGVGARVYGGAWEEFDLPQDLPNTDYGWGRVNLEETLYPTNGRSVKFVDRIPFADGVTNTFDIVTTNAAPLDVQLCWIDHPADASTDTGRTLVNDLDLVVSNKTSGLVWSGNGIAGGDRTNTMESVRIPLAEAGAYAILVCGHAVPYDAAEGGAAAVYVRGAFADGTAAAPEYVVNGRTGENYDSLDAALRAVETGDVLKVRRASFLGASVTVPTDCTVVADPAESGVVPTLRCTRGAVLSVPAGVRFALEGLVFTNACAGFDVAGRLEVTGTSFGGIEALTVADGGRAVLSNAAVTGDAPAVAVAAGGRMDLVGFTVSGAAADWTVAGTQTLQSVALATNQTVTVAPTGNLTLFGGITNLVQISLNANSTDGLTLAGPLTERIRVYAPDACTNGAPFGTYTSAPESAAYLMNMLDEEGELGGQAEGGILRWAVVEAPPEAAGSRVDIRGDGGVVRTYYYYTFKAALRVATNGVSTVTVVRDCDYTRGTTLPNDLTITSTNGATLALAGGAQFVVPPGVDLVLTNVTVRGGEQEIADCAFKVTGGSLTLEAGTTLSGLGDDVRSKTDGPNYGGAVVVTSGSVTMKSGARIADCASHYQGGAIWIGGKNSTANLLGGTIEDCSARDGASGGGAVYSHMKAHVNIGGDFTAIDNAMNADASPVPGNLYLSANTVFTLTNELTGAVGVSFGSATPDLNATNVCFIALGCELAPRALTNSAACFAHDVNTNLVGGCVEGQIVWTERVDDGQCDRSEAHYAVVIDEGGANEEWRYYEWIEDAFEHLDCDATVYCAEGDWLGRDIEIRHAVRLVSFMPDYLGVQTIQRLDEALVRILPGGSLTLENIQFSGLSGYTAYYPYYYENDSENGLFSVEGGSLTLDNGAVVGPVDGSDSRAANAISVCKGGTLTMLSGSCVYASQNAYVDTSDATGCGGGVLLDGATAYFRGGTIENCRAYRAGAAYVANGSKAYVSGNFTAVNNTDLTNGVDNVVVANGAELILAEAFTGSVGLNEGIACDTNCFGTVSANWAWTVDTLTNNAAKFFHDRRGVKGAAVTNGVGGAALVWSDLLNKAGKFTIDGQAYQIFLAPGQTVAVPKAFSVTPTTDANGAMVLTLVGGEEGCWYTVYSTDDLAKPFTAETSVQIKNGETFEYEIDRTAGAKFYKIVAEEGLK